MKITLYSRIICKQLPPSEQPDIDLLHWQDPIMHYSLQSLTENVTILSTMDGSVWVGDLVIMNRSQTPGTFWCTVFAFQAVVLTQVVQSSRSDHEMLETHWGALEVQSEGHPGPSWPPHCQYMNLSHHLSQDNGRSQNTCVAMLWANATRCSVVV